MAAPTDMEAKMSDPAVQRRAQESTCLPVLDKGCCCCTLSTCCQVQGWLSVIGGVAVPIMLVMGAVQFGEVLDHPSVTDDQRKMIHLAIIICWIGAVVGVATLVASILFLVGIDKSRPSYLRPYIALTWVSIFTQIIKVAVVNRAAPDIVGAVIGCAIVFYCFVCSHSLYVRMKAALEIYPGGVATKGTA